ncbi:vasculin-like [Saccoglossus kowalevskii]|uniref:Vasculin-like isoform X2 n=1 Tax=Saccoglossus kowalevskii TaxID=10224 RepID=A0ABM0MCJ9_SACKO|nr:PREDICTED: vasculin-like isoform X2 [Saccoglossus kowalevskii]
MPVDVMANPPQHDFAPAWLNFSTEQKPNKAHHHHHHHLHGRHDRNSRSYDPHVGHRLGNQRHYSSESHLEFDGAVIPPPAHHLGYGYRGRDDKRHYPPEGFIRHHSLDDDRYHHNYYQSGGDPVYPPGAQIWRGGYTRDTIYQHPNARYCGNGSYPVPVPSTNYHGNRGSSGGRQRYNSGSRNGYHERGHQDSVEEEVVSGNGKETEKENEASNNNNSVDTGEQFEQEFPSLSGDGIGGKDNQSSKLAGVWDKPMNSKIHGAGGRRMQLIQKPLRNENNDANTNTTSSNNSGSGDSATHAKLNPHAGIVNQANKTATCNSASSIYKSLVPSKGITKSAPRKVSPSIVKELNHKPAVTTPIQIKPSSTFPPATTQSFTKEIPQRPASTPPMEILNPRLVSAQTKKMDKKSDFLKELRKGGNNNNRDDETKDWFIEGDSRQVNGDDSDEGNVFDSDIKIGDVNSVHEEDNINVDKLDVICLEGMTISPGSSPMRAELSSSLEAERRLLREMGWQEDIDEKPLTEDELKEFQAKTAKLNSKPSKLRNGFNHMWSPVHNITNIDLNDSASSCSDTSDEEEEEP